MKAKVCLAVLAALPTLVSAQVNGTWINDRGGTWNNPTNWTSNPLLPDAGGIATFPSSTWNTVSILGTTTATLSQVNIDGPARYSFSAGPLNFAGPAVFNIGATVQRPSGATLGEMHRIASVTTTAGLDKNGPGLAWVSTSSITGGIRLNAGTFLVSANNPVSSNAGSITFNGGALHLTEPTGFTNALNVSAAGGTFAISPSLNYSFPAAGTTGAGPLTLKTLSTGSFSMSVPVALTGPLTVQAPVRLLNTGALNTIQSLDVSDQITLNAVANADRINDAAPITLRGGSIGGAFSPTETETLGNITLASGLCNLGGVGFGTTALNLNVNSITRNNHAIFGAGIGTALVITGPTKPGLSTNFPAGTPDVGILTWGRVENTGSISAMTIDPSGNVRALASTEYASAITLTGGSTNVLLTGNTSMGTIGFASSLTLSDVAGTGISLSGSSTLTLGHGAIFIAKPSTALAPAVISVPIDFAASEGIIHTPPTGSTSVLISGPLSGSNGLTLAGNVTLTGTSTYAGTTTVLGALTLNTNVAAGTPGPLGTSTSPVIIEGGQRASGLILAAPLGGGLTFTRDLIIHQPDAGSTQLTFEKTTGSVTMNGNIQFEGRLVASTTVSGAEKFVLASNISGSGYLQPANITLSGNNTFTGGVELSNRLDVGSDTALGTGPLWLLADNVDLHAVNGPRTISNDVYLGISGPRIGGSEAIDFTGTVNLGGVSRTLSFTNTATTTFSGRIINGSFGKFGTGMLRVRNIRLPGLTVSAGTLQILAGAGNDSTSLTPSLSIVSTLDLTDARFIYDYTPSPPANPNSTIRTFLSGGKLVSSVASASQAIGYADNLILNRSTFGGLSVDPSSVLIGLTYRGDANLDGKVDVADLGLLASHWQQSGYWIDGDFDYNGTIDVADLGALANNWQAGVSGGGLSFADAAAALGLSNVTLPEPTTISLLTIGATLVRRNRRASSLEMPSL